MIVPKGEGREKKRGRDGYSTKYKPLVGLHQYTWDEINQLLTDNPEATDLFVAHIEHGWSKEKARGKAKAKEAGA